MLSLFSHNVTDKVPSMARERVMKPLSTVPRTSGKTTPSRRQATKALLFYYGCFYLLCVLAAYDEARRGELWEVRLVRLRFRNVQNSWQLNRVRGE